jgi:hypothetical protein
MIMNKKIPLLRSLLVLLTLLLSWPSILAADKGYRSVLKEWTRDDEAYNWSQLEARLVWYATYLSHEFRSAKVSEYVRLYELDEKKKAELVHEEIEDANQYDSFFISVYAGSRQDPKIGKDRSLWRLVLETDGGEPVEPAAWTEVSRNQVTQNLYPYIDRWSRTYEVKFPKIVKQGVERLTLKMVGIPANSKLVWKLK